MLNKLDQLFHNYSDKISYLIYLLPFIIFMVCCLQAYSNTLTSVEVSGSDVILKVDGINSVKIRGNNTQEVTIILPNTVLNDVFNKDILTDQLQSAIPYIESVNIYQYSLEPAEARLVIKSVEKIQPKISQIKDSDKIMISLKDTAKINKESQPRLQPKININTVFDPLSISDELEEATYLRAEGKIEAAKAKIESVLTKSPDDLWANYYLSLIQMDEGKSDEAKKLNEKNLQQNPNFFASLYTMAIINDIDGKTDDAIELYKKVNKIFPDYQDSHYRLGLAYLKNKEFNLAEAEFKRTLMINPEHSSAMQNLGTVYLKQFNIDQAKECFKNAIRTDAINNLGNIFIQENENKIALKYLSFALTLDPDNAILNYNIGKVYHSMDKYDEALSYYKKAVEINPEMYNAHYNLALIYTIQGKNNKAVDEFTAYLDLNPGANDLEEVNSLISQLQSKKNDNLPTF